MKNGTAGPLWPSIDMKADSMRRPSNVTTKQVPPHTQRTYLMCRVNAWVLKRRSRL